MALGPQRLNAFIADEILHPEYAYGSTTIAQACERMKEVLKVLERLLATPTTEQEGHEKGTGEYT